MKKSLLFCLIFAAVLYLAAAVSAEQIPCTVDSFGCWIPVEEGKNYVRFWSEDARQYIENTGTDLTDLVLLHSDEDNSGNACQTLLVGGKEIKTCVQK